MPYGDGDVIQALSTDQCEKQNVQCAACGKQYYRCYVYNQCPCCGEQKFVLTTWWHGMPIPQDNILGKILLDGRKIVPKFFVEVRAFLNPHPSGDHLSSWQAAETWFKDQGWEWVENEEWYSYNRKIEKSDGIFFDNK